VYGMSVTVAVWAIGRVRVRAQAGEVGHRDRDGLRAHAVSRDADSAAPVSRRQVRRVHNPASMSKSRVRLPREVREPFQVFLNGVPQHLGEDFEIREGALVFEGELRKDNISKRRWLLGAWGVGTYRQNDSVDVRYEAADGSPRLAEALEIEPKD
jgi:hypothetical protein